MITLSWHTSSGQEASGTFPTCQHRQKQKVLGTFCFPYNRGRQCCKTCGFCWHADFFLGGQASLDVGIPAQRPPKASNFLHLASSPFQARPRAAPHIWANGPPRSSPPTLNDPDPRGSAGPTRPPNPGAEAVRVGPPPPNPRGHRGRAAPGNAGSPRRAAPGCGGGGASAAVRGDGGRAECRAGAGQRGVTKAAGWRAPSPGGSPSG